MQLLDFEKPIAELEKRLVEMRQFNADNEGVDLAESIAALEGKIQALRESVYKKLTPWQR